MNCTLGQQRVSRVEVPTPRFKRRSTLKNGTLDKFVIKTKHLKISTYAAVADIMFIASWCKLVFIRGIHSHRRTASVCVTIRVTYSTFAATYCQSDKNNETISQCMRNDRHYYRLPDNLSASQTREKLPFLGESVLHPKGLREAAIVLFNSFPVLILTRVKSKWRKYNRRLKSKTGSQLKSL